jgi:hypothetical protein
MIVDCRYNPASLELCARVYRPFDGAWYDPETRSWRDGGVLPADDFSFLRVLGLDCEYTLTIPTPPEMWGLNVEVIVYVFAYMDEEWQVVDRVVTTVNPTIKVEGYHFVAAAGKPGDWVHYQPQIK